MKSLTQYFHMKTKILADFQIRISVPLRNGRELLNLSSQTLFFRGFWRFLAFFSLFYTYLELKRIHCSHKVSVTKRQPIWQEEGDRRYEGRKWMLFGCYILDIYYSLNNIIHWIIICAILRFYTKKTRKIVARLKIS